MRVSGLCDVKDVVFPRPNARLEQTAGDGTEDFKASRAASSDSERFLVNDALSCDEELRLLL